MKKSLYLLALFLSILVHYQYPAEAKSVSACNECLAQRDCGCMPPMEACSMVCMGEKLPTFDCASICAGTSCPSGCGSRELCCKSGCVKAQECPLTDNIDEGLFEVLTKGDTKTAEFLIDKGADVNKGLYWAVYSDNIAITRILIDKGANVNAIGGAGMTLLMDVAWKGKYADMVKFLIGKGAKLDIKDDFGRTALSNCKDTSIRQILIQAGAK